MPTNALEFQKSITRQLYVERDHVRNLISGANWGEEGRSKEAVLRTMIRKFLPSNISIGTGFVIKENDSLYISSLDAKDISKQIDIILYDNTCPPLFSEGEFIITTASSVKGLIEVKSGISTTKLAEAIKKGDSNGDLFDKRKNIFNGIFVFDYTNTIAQDTLKDILYRGKGNVNHIALGPDIFIRYWKKKSLIFHSDIGCHKSFYGFYKIQDLAFSYFISNIIECLLQKKCGDRSWFLFPIEGTKEKCRFDYLCMGDSL
jgi:hypothetical protein